MHSLLVMNLPIYIGHKELYFYFIIINRYLRNSWFLINMWILLCLISCPLFFHDICYLLLGNASIIFCLCPFLFNYIYISSPEFTHKLSSSSTFSLAYYVSCDSLLASSQECYSSSHMRSTTDQIFKPDLLAENKSYLNK